MRALMDKMMADTASPLIHGHVDPPEKQLHASASHSVGGAKFQEHVQKRQDLLC